MGNTWQCVDMTHAWYTSIINTFLHKYNSACLRTVQTHFLLTLSLLNALEVISTKILQSLKMEKILHWFSIYIKWTGNTHQFVTYATVVMNSRAIVYKTKFLRTEPMTINFHRKPVNKLTDVPMTVHSPCPWSWMTRCDAKVTNI
jgi:hypothetical protein